MNFSWFGWLTKGAMEVSFLDRLTLLGELAICFLAFCFFLALPDIFGKKGPKS